MTNWDEIDSPAELAARLRDTANAREVQALEPIRFQELFDRVYSATSDPNTLWLLGGIAADYQRFNGVEIRVPVELPRLLLASRNKDSRIIGLKLLARSSEAREEEVVGAILRALNRCDEHESTGGICETMMFLDRRYPGGGLPAPEVVASLVAALEPLARSVSGDPELVDYAARQIRRLTNP
jgi:hypothetical protein